MVVPGLEATPNKRDVIFYQLLCELVLVGACQRANLLQRLR